MATHSNSGGRNAQISGLKILKIVLFFAHRSPKLYNRPGKHSRKRPFYISHISIKIGPSNAILPKNKEGRKNKIYNQLYSRRISHHSTRI